MIIILICHLNLIETFFGLINLEADLQQLLSEACLRPGTDPRCADLILVLFLGLDPISIANSNVGIT